MAATGLLAMSDATTGLTGGPGDVNTSNDGATVPTKTKLLTPTSEKNLTKKAMRPAKKQKKPDHSIKIPQDKNEDEKMKQPSLKNSW